MDSMQLIPHFHMPADTPTLLQDGLKTEDPESLYPGFFQIDYILCRSRSTSSLVDARSYAGAKLQSDHKIVKASFDLGKRYKFYSTAKHSVKQYNTNSLVCSKEVQVPFNKMLLRRLKQIHLPSQSLKVLIIFLRRLRLLHLKPLV